MIQIINLALPIVIKNIKVDEIKVTLFNKDPLAILEDGALVVTAIINPE